jgi:uncharacterized membrane protein YhhN
MIPVVLCGLCVAGLLLAEWRGSRPGVWATKPLAAAAFLAAAWHWGALDSSYGRWVLGALGLCAAGDVLLIPKERPTCFQLGILAFLLGHVGFAIAFLGAGVQPTGVLLATVPLVAFAFGALRWLAPHVPADFRRPVRAYVGVISAMVVCALAWTAAGGPAAASLGAIGFAASDLSVARDRFVAPGLVNGAWGLPLYFGSQLVLASTVAAQVAA